MYTHHPVYVYKSFKIKNLIYAFDCLKSVVHQMPIWFKNLIVVDKKRTLEDSHESGAHDAEEYRS